MTQRLEEERGELLGADAEAQEREREARETVQRIEAALHATEAELGGRAGEARLGVNARRDALEAALAEENRRHARFEAELTRVETEFALIASEGGGAQELARLEEALQMADEEAEAADLAAREREDAHKAAREAEAAARGAAGGRRAARAAAGNRSAHAGKAAAIGVRRALGAGAGADRRRQGL